MPHMKILEDVVVEWKCFQFFENFEEVEWLLKSNDSEWGCILLKPE